MDLFGTASFSVCSGYIGFVTPSQLVSTNSSFLFVDIMATPNVSSTPAHQSSPPRSNGAAATTFTVPGVYDAVFYSTPDAQSLLLHAVASSSEEEGFQAIICFHPRPHLPSHLGLPVLSSYEDKAFLQVSLENTPFMLQSQAPKTHAMQVTVTEYLILLQFVGHEWPRLQSKLNSQLLTMREGTDPVFMSGHLMFYNHGASHFRVSLSSRLTFRACVESRDPAQKIKTWLERRPLSDANGDSSSQEMALPMSALTILTQDTNGVKALVEQMAAYKNRSRKRNKSVLS